MSFRNDFSMHRFLIVSCLCFLFCIFICFLVHKTLLITYLRKISCPYLSKMQSYCWCRALSKNKSIGDLIYTQRQHQCIEVATLAHFALRTVTLQGNTVTDSCLHMTEHVTYKTPNFGCIRSKREQKYHTSIHIRKDSES